MNNSLSTINKIIQDSNWNEVGYQDRFSILVACISTLYSSKLFMAQDFYYLALKSIKDNIIEAENFILHSYSKDQLIAFFNKISLYLTFQ